MPQYAFQKWEGLGNHFVLFSIPPSSSAAPPLPSEAETPAWSNENHQNTDNNTVQSLLLSDSLKWKEFAQKVGSVRRGVGCDQLAVVERVSPISAAVRLFNGGTGEEVGMCGNAIRCIAAWLYEQHCPVEEEQRRASSFACTVEVVSSQRRMECVVREKTAAVEGASTTSSSSSSSSSCVWNVAVAMGPPVQTAFQIPFHPPPPSASDLSHGFGLCGRPPRGVFAVPLGLTQRELPKVPQRILDTMWPYAYVVGFGNPHVVLLWATAEAMDEEKEGSGRGGDLSDQVVNQVGDWLCNSAASRTKWFPEGVNVSFVRCNAASLRGGDGDLRCRVRVYERGEGITDACGSAACAVGTVLAVLRGSSAEGGNGQGCKECHTTTVVVMDGGSLGISVTTATMEDGEMQIQGVSMQGDATHVFNGTLC